MIIYTQDLKSISNLITRLDFLLNEKNYGIQFDTKSNVVSLYHEKLRRLDVVFNRDAKLMSELLMMQFLTYYPEYKK